MRFAAYQTGLPFAVHDVVRTREGASFGPWTTGSVFEFENRPAQRGHGNGALRVRLSADLLDPNCMDTKLVRRLIARKCVPLARLASDAIGTGKLEADYSHRIPADRSCVWWTVTYLHEDRYDDRRRSAVVTLERRLDTDKPDRAALEVDAVAIAKFVKECGAQLHAAVSGSDYPAVFGRV